MFSPNFRDKYIQIFRSFDEYFSCVGAGFYELFNALFKTSLFVGALFLLVLSYTELDLDSAAVFGKFLRFIQGPLWIYSTLLLPFVYVLNPQRRLQIGDFMLRMIACLFLFFFALLNWSGNANASSLTVIEDQGGASALPYYERLQPNPQTSDIKEVKPIPLQGPVTEAHMLPVVSHKLSPGRVVARVNNAGGLSQPIFLIGSDDLSVVWLKQRGDVLRELGAVGLVVNVSDANSLASLRKVAAGLTLIPASGDDIAGLLKISHYPVLITQTGIEQ
jgi:integrating conjugative element protein (TIGR03765 family)